VHPLYLRIGLGNGLRRRRPAGADHPDRVKRTAQPGGRRRGGELPVIHVRAVSPPETTDRLLEALRTDPGVQNVVVLRHAAVHPDGDAVYLDVLNGSANQALATLRGFEIDRRGSIVFENVDAHISDLATATRSRQGRFQDFSPVWEEVEARIRSGGEYPPSWFLLLAIAGVIGAVGILTNSQILIVAAMVIGPEYGAITSVALGLTQRDRGRVMGSLAALAAGFAGAVVAAGLFGLVIRGAGLEPRAFQAGVRPVSSLINNPNVFSVVVAVLAGIVGIVSLSESRTSTLMGVFISVTTIPAAADMGVSAAFGSWKEARGSTTQLILNVVLLILVGALSLVVQHRLWRRAGQPPARRRDRPRRGLA
jgi:uncharacterized hydrophobic protein (TIGR00271 family)